VSVMFAPCATETAELPPGTLLLNGLYQIVEPLQQGGFALTYVARDSLERHVVIKECFPAGVCARTNGRVHTTSPHVEQQFEELKQQFLREARGMAKLKHPHVVAVHQVFEENNTAYMALDYVAGMDLISVLEDEPERLTAAFFETTLRETLKAVRHIHSNGVLHRDIAPDNIRVDGSDRITLIDFGAARARGAGAAVGESALTAIKDGYSPPEFYDRNEIQDSSSDLYSIAATFHHLITGEVPPNSQYRMAVVAAGGADPVARLTEGDWNCGHHVLATIDQALTLNREGRIQTAEQWLKALDEMPKVRPAPARTVVLDPALETAISKLVQDVNDNLTPGFPAPHRDARQLELVQAKNLKPKEKRWVDIVGNPVSDIAEWLDQQEKLLLAPAPNPAHQPTAQEDWAEPPMDIEQAEGIAPALPTRKSFLGSLFARVMSRTPETCPT
jgi:serine/threonine protein kinase